VLVFFLRKTYFLSNLFGIFVSNSNKNPQLCQAAKTLCEILQNYMASGFITLQDGKNWSARWSYYDWVLGTIMNRLKSDSDEGYLKKWLDYILPNEENGDIESGYCFYKKVGPGKDEFESILRKIDTRLMNQTYCGIFWNTVETLSNELDSEDGEIGFLIHQLHNSYLRSLSSTEVEPIPEEEEDDDDDNIFDVGGFKIGK